MQIEINFLPSHCALGEITGTDTHEVSFIVILHLHPSTNGDFISYTHQNASGKKLFLYKFCTCNAQKGVIDVILFHTRRLEQAVFVVTLNFHGSKLAEPKNMILTCIQKYPH